MSTLAFTSAGSTVYISAGVPATIDSTGFGGLTYTKIGDVTEIGVVGTNYAMVEHTPVDGAVKYKYKTINDNGNVTLKGARVPSDAGQTLLNTASQSYSPYAMKIVLQNGAIIYGQVLVQSFQTNIGNAGQITAFDSTCPITGNLVFA